MRMSTFFDPREQGLSTEQLLVLNQLLQNLESLEQRLDYIHQIEGLYDFLQYSQDFLLDERDANIYSIVRVGQQRWLGENLRYKSTHYYENEANPSFLYGLLYNWAAVMGVPLAYNESAWEQQNEGHRGIAPLGCHIPTDAEWLILEQQLGMDRVESRGVFERGTLEGRQLKSSEGWRWKDFEAESGNGTNSSQFNALPAGGYWWSGNFLSLGAYAGFWSSTESSLTGAWYRSLDYAWDRVNRSNGYKANGFSCRCLLDEF